MDEFFKAMIKQLIQGLKEVGISLGTHVWLNRRARKDHGGEASKPAGTGKFYDEGVLLRAYADLAQELKSSGMPGDEVNRIIAEVADFFSDPKQSTPKEAETFRLSIAAMAHEEGLASAWRQLNLLAEADAAGKKALAAQLARPTLFVKWVEKSYIEAGRVWERTIRSLPQALALRVRAFIRILGPIEAFQFTHSLGRIPDDTERLRLLQEILNPPAGITNIELAQARGLIDISQAHKIQERLGQEYRQLRTDWQACLNRWQAPVQRWERVQVRRARTPHRLNFVARIINWIIR